LQFASPFITEDFACTIDTLELGGSDGAGAVGTRLAHFPIPVVSTLDDSLVRFSHGSFSFEILLILWLVLVHNGRV